MLAEFEYGLGREVSVALRRLSGKRGVGAGGGGVLNALLSLPIATLCDPRLNSIGRGEGGGDGYKNSSPLELERREGCGLDGGEGYAELAGLGADERVECGALPSEDVALQAEREEWKDCAGEGDEARDAGSEYALRMSLSMEGERGMREVSTGLAGSDAREGKT